jgi:hypothetical protein
MVGWFWVDNTSSMEQMCYGGGTGFTDLGTSRLLAQDNLGYWAGSNFSSISSSIPTGQWYNIIGAGREVSNEGNDVMSLYINGVLVKSINNASLFIRTNRAVFSNGDLFGRIAMMSIYNYEFSAADAATYYNNTKELFGY